MPPKNTPTAPSTYIRLKHSRTTILLLTTLLTPLSTLIADLLSALRERYPDGLPSVSANGDGDVEETLVSLPTSAEDVEIAVPNDPYDSAAGWREVDWVEGDQGGLKGLGVPEGGVLAFRVRGEEEWGVVFPSYDDEEVVDEGMEAVDDEEGREMEVVVGKGKGRARVEDSEGEDEL